jgi:hypothetical protein
MLESGRGALNKYKIQKRLSWTEKIPKKKTLD